MTNPRNLPCPCGSQVKYKQCCKPFHIGKSPENALKLMKSRYSAYALCQTDYIINTTHPSSTHYQKDKDLWKNEILQFCNETHFDNLEIHNFIDGQEEAFVFFTAHLTQNEQDATFSEKSRFLFKKNVWLYLEGEVCHTQE